jgi:hypothetical protein
MSKYSPTVKLIIALVVIIILGKTLDIIDQAFGTNSSAASGIWLAGIAAILFAAYVYLAFKKKQ